jgi:hypothetical protein
MAKQIKPTEAAVDAALAQARKQLLAQKSADGKLKVEVNLPAAEKRVRVQFTPVAYAKMLSLIHEFGTEVAWHGIVIRESMDLFRINDILVYPQGVTGTTVRTNESYANAGKSAWLMQLDDDTFNALRMQSHSHVNMDAKPSPQDLTDQSIILDQMGSGCDFYIFMVWNKRLEHDIRVYDLEANLLYEDGDVDVSIGENGIDLSGFAAGAKELVKTPAPVKQTSFYPQRGYDGLCDYPPDDDPWPIGKSPHARAVKARRRA